MWLGLGLGSGLGLGLGLGATAASATCQGTIQCRQPAKAKRETTRASWRDQVEGIARKADPSWPLVATCHTRQACVMVVRCGLERACDYSARGGGQCCSSERCCQASGRGCTCVAERCSVSRRAFSFLTAATSCASSRLAAPPRVWRWRRSSSSRFVARLVAGTLCSRGARGFSHGLAVDRCWGVTTASFTPSLFCASRVAGTPLSTAICFFRAGLVAVTDRPARPGDASLATAQSRLAHASRRTTNILIGRSRSPPVRPRGAEPCNRQHATQATNARPRVQSLRRRPLQSPPRCQDGASCL